MAELIETNVSYDLIGKGYNIRKKYYIEVIHNGLKEHKVFSGTDMDILKTKSIMFIQKLDDKWNKYLEKERINQLKKEAKLSKEELLNEAAKLTEEAQSELNEIENILNYTLHVNDEIDWEKLKNNSEYAVANPMLKLDSEINSISKPKRAKYKTPPEAPNRASFSQKISFFEEYIFKSRRKQKIELEEKLYNDASEKWEAECKAIKESNNLIDVEYSNSLKDYEISVNSVKHKIKKEVEEWEIQKENYYKEQQNTNSKIDNLKLSYFNSEWDAIIEHSDLVLSNSNYPSTFPKDWDLEYNQESKSLILDYSLPSINCFPKISEVKVVKEELKEYYISEVQLSKFYESSIYRITLRRIHELFEADVIDAFEQITFNGWVNEVNKANGKIENNCILSIQVKKLDFIDIDLANIDPKTCFKNLKGVSSSKLVNLTPIKPIIQINRNDKRFTNHYDVANTLDSSLNLASMDWEDFEHLIREIFAKEFSSNGGEVKVTQASRDGGVDAIAFDPDPIRGGKIVIQAKRYTNTVGVSAVRDLYGTVMNEGATKGILVTTSDYGPDAYEFASGKPITLMNGSNLLYLLERHGHIAKIDIKEAKLNK